MKTSLINNITFSKTAKTVTFNGLVALDLTRLVSVINVTRGTTLYHRNLPQLGGEQATNVLTLAFDTNNASYDDADLVVAEYVTGNCPETILSSAAHTATFQSSQIDNYGAKGATFFINVSAVTGTTPTLTVQIQVKDPVSGNWKDIPGAVTPSITATGQTTLTLYPGIAETANVEQSIVLPRQYRLSCTIGGTTPNFTFSVGALYIP